MKRVLLTGMSGTGKSTVIQELAARGDPAVMPMRRDGRNLLWKDPHELDRTLALQQTIEPLLRRAADLEIETSAPLDQVVATILRHIQH